jgi:hypothetical protein
MAAVLLGYNPTSSLRHTRTGFERIVRSQSERGWLATGLDRKAAASIHGNDQSLNQRQKMVISDQGFMPLYEVKKQMELFGTKVMPEFMG